MANIVVNTTTRITATFTGNVGSPIPMDPQFVQLSILDSLGNTISTPSPVRDAVGIYHYDWTAVVPGDFTIQFTANWIAGLPTVVNTSFQVVPATGSHTTASVVNLGQDATFTFLINPEPLYLDPEEFVSMFPDAPLSQIAELIYIYSSETANLLQTTVVDSIIQQEIYDYVQAATACSLTKIYDITMGADESMVTLGDLTIQTRRQIKDSVNRSNATTWCQLASVIRNELYAVAKKSGLRAVMKGSKYFNPIPPRYVQHIEWRTWENYSGQ